MHPALYDQVIEWLPPNARVLDLGAGDGAFLERLVKIQKVRAEGVERDPVLVSRCIERGLVVHQGDIADGLDQYASGAFDHVLLLGTFQELLAPADILREAFRVGREVIIAYTNFAHIRVRLQILFEGRTPITRSLPAPVLRARRTTRDHAGSWRSTRTRCWRSRSTISFGIAAMIDRPEPSTGLDNCASV